MKVNIGIIQGFCPEHKHKCYEYLIYTEGVGIIKTDTAHIPFSPGTVIVIPPDTLHYSVSDGYYERIFITGNLDLIFNISEPTALSCVEERDGLILAKLIYENRYKNSDYLAALLNAFSNYILRSIELNDKIGEAVSAIINEITESFSDSNISLPAILKKSGYAEDYIRDRFKKATGKTPVRFLTEIRISHSCLLIDSYRNSLSLSEIAERCGFTDYVYFSRRFKEITGVSPREYSRIR